MDRKTFHWLMDAWAFSGEWDAADNAAALLLRMEELHDMGESHICPDVRSYTKVMNAMSRSGQPDAGILAEQLFARMETSALSGKNVAAQPNSFTYTALMEAYANCGNAKKAEEVLDSMIELYHTEESTVVPTARNFNACISAYAKMGQPLQAETVFLKMEEHYEQDGNAEAEPNSYHYNSVITAWANCPEEGSAQRAEEVLARMAIPTTVSYNAVIDAWAKSGVDDAAERAEELLTKMEHLYETGTNMEAKPNVRSFNSVINVWAKSKRVDAAQKAEGVLHVMERLYQEGNVDVRPDVHSFTSVINGTFTSSTLMLFSNTITLSHKDSFTLIFIYPIPTAWARSQTNGKAERAQTLLRQMNQMYLAGDSNVKPNVVAYNAVMNACAWTDGDVSEKNRAMDIAHHVMKELESSSLGRPDQVTYGTFLKVCATQMADCDSRRTIVEMLFRKCCKDGQVGHMVLTQLQQLVTDVKYEQITGRWPEAEIKMEDLPQEWWCNVVEGKYSRRKQREEEHQQQQQVDVW